ncbi:MAG: SWF/SNF helicase family protein [Deltaproteobacteria bacterium]|nr:SWF/SNF helicase family protein [Nannocystaceae bacterium]
MRRAPSPRARSLRARRTSRSPPASSTRRSATICSSSRRSSRSSRSTQLPTRCSVFLISLEAGGSGITLTEADTVIHYDPWWNPAVEDQATDRAHRIGQEKPVMVYRMVMEDTVEQKMVELGQRKRAVAESAQGRDASGGKSLTMADIDELLRTPAINPWD